MTVSTAKTRRGEEDSTAEAQRDMTSRDLADFMLFFAKFEYALVRAGYTKAGKNIGEENGKKVKTCEADWDEFARSIPNTFFEKIKPEYPEIFNDDGPQAWGFIDGEQARFYSYNRINGMDSIEKLIKACKQVRSNLIHGEKLLHDYEDVGRNHRLLKESSGILMSALDQIRQKDGYAKALEIFKEIPYKS